MSEIAKTLSCCALLLALGSGCDGGGRSKPGMASKVQLFNCTHVNGPTGPPSGRAFNIYTRVDGGPGWVGRGGLNPQPGDWTDCHDAAHEAASLTLNLVALTLEPGNSSGKWEIRAIKVPRSDEPVCDSSAPDVPNACGYLPYALRTDGSASTVKIDVSDQQGR